MEEVKGFRDITGDEARKRELVKNFNLFGFKPAETPVIEYENFVKSGNAQDEAISDVYKLTDKGQRKLALRYEFTFQLKRLAENKKLPFKRYQVGEVFRDEPISENRFRQITQCDIDIVGSSINNEPEILAAAKSVFDELKIKYTIFVNNRRLLNEILEENKIKNKEQVIKEIDKMDKLSEKEVFNNLKKYDAEKLVNIFKKPESYFKKYNSYREIEDLAKYCRYYGVKFKFMPGLARGLSYYNGNVLEIKSSGMKETIAAGGSYLVNGIQSFGIAFGLDRIAKLAKLYAKEKSVLVISLGKDKEAIALANKLRSGGVNTSIMFGKITKALDYANSYDIKYVIFVGEEEIKKKKFKLKDMKTGKEEFLSFDKLLKKL